MWLTVVENCTRKMYLYVREKYLKSYQSLQFKIHITLWHSKRKMFELKIIRGIMRDEDIIEWEKCSTLVTSFIHVACLTHKLYIMTASLKRISLLSHNSCLSEWIIQSVSDISELSSPSCRIQNMYENKHDKCRTCPIPLNMCSDSLFLTNSLVCKCFMIFMII